MLPSPTGFKVAAVGFKVGVAAAGLFIVAYQLAISCESNPLEVPAAAVSVAARKARAAAAPLPPIAMDTRIALLSWES